MTLNARTSLPALAILDGFLFADEDDGSLLTLPVGVELTPELENRLYLYRQASLSYAIAVVGMQRPSIRAIQVAMDHRMEERVDPTTYDRMKQQLNEAVQDIHKLMTEQKEVTWARAWLEKSGAVQTDPVTLTTFAVGVMGYVTTRIRGLDLFEVAP